MSVVDEIHPVSLVVGDDLERRRLTVFFRLLLAIPHFIWVLLWGIAAVVSAIVCWFAMLATGRPPEGLHGFLSRYVRYVAHVSAYVGLVASPYPGFAGAGGSYPIDVLLPPPEPQPRWKTLLRLLLAIPALLVSAALGGVGTIRFPAGRGSGRLSGSAGGALGGVCAILGWFASMARGRMPRGLRDAGAYSVGYGAQVLAYLLLVTDRYPNADPTAMLADVPRPPQHPVHLVGDAHDLRHSRVLVLFRLPLAVPHIVWLVLWSVAAFLASLVNWLVALVTGRPAAAIHRFLVRFVRYTLHVYAFLYLAAGPFPGFAGVEGSYPIDVVLPGPERQSRWRTGFRLVLAFPALIVNGVLGSALLIAAVLTWFVALGTGSASWGLRNLSAYALRYGAQTNAYLLLITERYPHASPLEGADEPLAGFDAHET